jgi:hypothetical protein
MTKNTLRLLPALMSLVFLAGCTAPMLAGGAVVGGGMYATSPGDLPPADTADQMPAHQSWCYSTMGEAVECFSEPQDTPPGRLVNVDPANLYPLNAKAYDKALAESRAADAPKEAAMPPEDHGAAAPGSAMPLAVVPARMMPVPLPSVAPEVAPAPKPAVKPAPGKTKSAVKKHTKHKKAKKAVPPAAPDQPASAPPQKIPD